MSDNLTKREAAVEIIETVIKGTTEHYGKQVIIDDQLSQDIESILSRVGGLCGQCENLKDKLHGCTVALDLAVLEKIRLRIDLDDTRKQLTGLGDDATSMLEIYGSDPDFTGELSVEEFLRRQRGESQREEQKKGDPDAES